MPLNSLFSFLHISTKNFYIPLSTTLHTVTSPTLPNYNLCGIFGLGRLEVQFGPGMAADYCLLLPFRQIRHPFCVSLEVSGPLRQDIIVVRAYPCVCVLNTIFSVYGVLFGIA